MSSVRGSVFAALLHHMCLYCVHLDQKGIPYFFLFASYTRSTLDFMLMLVCTNISIIFLFCQLCFFFNNLSTLCRCQFLILLLVGYHLSHGLFFWTLTFVNDLIVISFLVMVAPPFILFRRWVINCFMDLVKFVSPLVMQLLYFWA